MEFLNLPSSENTKEPIILQFFQIAGISICVKADMDASQTFFNEKLTAFSVSKPGNDLVTLTHHFGIPEVTETDLGREVYRKPPWAIYQQNKHWCYLGIMTGSSEDVLWKLAVFNADHTQGKIFNKDESPDNLYQTGFSSLSGFPTDQIWLCPLLADRQAVLLHSAGAVVNGRGFIFVGHSEAGKSTTMEMLKAAKERGELDAEILCDDRNILRKWDTDWYVHGTWSHGTTSDVSPASAPLAGILFLEQSPDNQIIPMTNRKQVWRGLLATLIRSLVTAEWWQKELDILAEIVSEVPAYRMCFDKSGKIVSHLEQLR